MSVVVRLTSRIPGLVSAVLGRRETSYDVLDSYLHRIIHESSGDSSNDENGTKQICSEGNHGKSSNE